MPGRSRHTEGLVLRCVDVGDADRIVAFLTPDLGRISAVARGARSSRKRFGGALQSGYRVDLVLSPGRGDLARLESAAPLETFEGLLVDLGRIGLAGRALARVRDHVLPEVAEPELYEAAVAYLRAQSARDADESLLFAFELRMLALLGHAPALDACPSCGRPAPEGRAAHFDPRRGAVICRACGGGPVLLSGRARGVMRAATEEFDPATVWDDGIREEVRAALEPFSRSQLDAQRSCRGREGF